MYQGRDPVIFHGSDHGVRDKNALMNDMIRVLSMFENLFSQICAQVSRLRFLTRNCWIPELISAIKSDSVYGSNDFDQFLVKWLGHDRSKSTWETRFAIRRIKGGPDAIQQYEQPNTTTHTTIQTANPKTIFNPNQSSTHSTTKSDPNPKHSQLYNRPSTIVGSRGGTHMPIPSPISPGVLNQNMESSNQAASTKTGMRQRVHGV
jgi:hypothetical protein